jgi:predicted transcriptional regulator
LTYPSTFPKSGDEDDDVGNEDEDDEVPLSKLTLGNIPPLMMKPINIGRAMNDVEVWTIIGRNTVFPKEVVETVIPAIDGLQKSGKIKGKMLDTVSIALYISDSQSAAMLPNMKGDVDMSMLLVGSDPLFNEWCLDLFNHFWECAGPASLDKAKIV